MNILFRINSLVFDALQGNAETVQGRMREQIRMTGKKCPVCYQLDMDAGAVALYHDLIKLRVQKRFSLHMQIYIICYRADFAENMTEICR